MIFFQIFSHERKLYTRQTLALHRRKGDPDDSSHKGHPLCEFCQVRFLDNDELFRHLRRDHFFCHFCDADGVQVYYENYPGLQEHFRLDHFLCEEGPCKNEQFTSAFRTEIDLKAHVVERHSGGLTKAAARQNRTVDLDFSYSRPSARTQVNRRRGRDTHDSDSDTAEQSNGRSGMPDMSSENFPSLGSDATAAPSGAAAGSLAGRVALSSGHSVASGSAKWVSGKGGLTNPSFLEEHFPSLGGESGPGVQNGTSLNYKQAGSRPAEKKSQKSTKSFPTEEYPTLAAPSKGGSNLLANFKPATTSAYRYPSGYKPPWQASSNAEGSASSGGPSGMVPLTKSTRKTPAPPPDIPIDEESEYPLLTPNAQLEPEVGKSSKSGKKNMKKSGKTENIANESKQENSLLVTSLAAAADLISLDPKAKSSSNKKPSKLTPEVQRFGGNKGVVNPGGQRSRHSETRYKT